MQGDDQIRQIAGENIRSITRTSAEFTSQFIAGRLRDVSEIANSTESATQWVMSRSAWNRSYQRFKSRVCSPHGAAAVVVAPFAGAAWGIHVLSFTGAEKIYISAAGKLKTKELDAVTYFDLLNIRCSVERCACHNRH